MADVNIDMIKSVSLFNGLEDSDIEKIVSVVQTGKIPANTEFFKEGDIGDAFYVLTNGEKIVMKGKKENMNLL